MNRAEMEKAAHAYADEIAPPPKYEPFNAGIMSGAATMGLLVMFLSIAKIDWSGLTLHVTGTTLAVGIGVWFNFKKQGDRNFSAYFLRLQELEQRERRAEEHEKAMKAQKS